MIAVLLSPGCLAPFPANQVVLSQRFNFLYTQFVSSLSLFFISSDGKAQLFFSFLHFGKIQSSLQQINRLVIG